MPILLIIMYIININYVQYFTFTPIEIIKYSYRNGKMMLRTKYYEGSTKKNENEDCLRFM